MPVHDWTKLDDGAFHSFHVVWQTHVCETLNTGLLPQGFYAQIETHAGLFVPDVTTLATSAALSRSSGPGIALAEPVADRRVKYLVEPRPRRQIAIHGPKRVVAVIEIISRANKDRPKHVANFVNKAVDFLVNGINVAVIDILPPGLHDPNGMHAEISREIAPEVEAAFPPADRPLTIASYRADTALPPEAYLYYAAVGGRLPGLPLFLHEEVRVDLPLESTYMMGYDRLPAVIKAELG